MTSDSPDLAALSSSFGGVSEQYDRVRPAYPDEAVAWMLPAGARRVVDLGAGTGKLTRLLADRGLDVTAVEPDDRMRAVLADRLPGVTAVRGSGEAIPVGDGEEDAVLVAQAWHWMDAGEAAREAARVLRPGGRLGIVWNVMDGEVDWVRELDAILDGGRRRGARAAEPGPFPGFGPVEHASFAHAQRMTPEDVVDLAGSISRINTLPDDARAGVLDDIRTLLAGHPDTAGRDALDLPYRADAYRAQLGG
ncbi:class I SAM-dependent methyltransferase [Clavibacter michiganensis]|uniref:SAM-dependant methyltransferase n=1 Tax=Clavibacter michiganensis subsp. michiganensis (strain NCPPB 382) TaxID=443906 RepID=A5CR22_CLAM3|nr:class I SAM-dependent methyltransferase [Clavibacter michiganensis]MDO4024808.1 class I SAM-dependent methyltransferase [Clavibacter michiganensis]MDO4027938.1 class I SAM-dependent methyltransferase [Clavibacter michiganensis]MDO4034644.1 class I SAM-dependent methyltransferase [Clavibacter michiganensis]MDO4046489.1 class I SAM-dependent methyltransferase [Clavibacter michiganensis]MDO4064530.1 class I SAM-dependent methyltransferase [Clavibacter michiganensis]